jgi:hypothetical protein
VTPRKAPTWVKAWQEAIREVWRDAVTKSLLTGDAMSQQPRTSVDLINELETEGSHYTKVALAVGFENTTRFIFSGADDNLPKLNAMMLEGGEPVGFLVCALAK